MHVCLGLFFTAAFLNGDALKAVLKNQEAAAAARASALLNPSDPLKASDMDVKALLAFPAQNVTDARLQKDIIWTQNYLDRLCRQQIRTMAARIQCDLSAFFNEKAIAKRPWLKMVGSVCRWSFIEEHIRKALDTEFPRIKKQMSESLLALKGRRFVRMIGRWTQEETRVMKPFGLGPMSDADFCLSAASVFKKMEYEKELQAFDGFLLICCDMAIEQIEDERKLEEYTWWEAFMCTDKKEKLSRLRNLIEHVQGAL